MKNLFTYLLAIFFFHFSPCQSQTWTQLGQDINGEAPGDYCGGAVALSSDGSIVAIGAAGNDGSWNFSGHVRVFNYDGGSWVQLGQDIDGESTDDYSGRSVSLSSDGSILAVGAVFNNGSGDASGHVRVFNYDGVNWVQIGQDIDGESTNNFSGNFKSVSLSSDGATIAIGATGNDGNSGNVNDERGHVRVFNYDGANWVQLGQDIDGEASEDYSGTSVSLSSDGSIVAIGALGNDDNGAYAGHTRVYEYDGSAWLQIGQDIDGEAAEDRCGISVSLDDSGNILAIGSQTNDSGAFDAGHVRIYSFSGTNWVQLGNSINGVGVDDQFGSAVSLNATGNRVCVGAGFSDFNNVNSGHVGIYDWDGLNWIQIGENIVGDSTNDYSGSAMWLSADGNRVAIGAYGDDGNGTNAGLARVYELDCGPVTFLPNILGETNINPLTSYSYVISQPPSGFTIDWSVVNGALTSGQGTTVANVFWDANGYGQLVVSLSDGGCPVSDTLVVGHPPVSIFDLLSEETNISPNPSTGIFTVNVPYQINIQASVFDALGKLVTTSNETGTFNLDLSDMPVGVYTLRLDTESGTLTKKLVRE